MVSATTDDCCEGDAAAFGGLNELELKAIKKRFRDIYYNVKGDHALSDTAGLLNLEKLNGAYDDCQDVLIAGNKKYTSDYFCKQALGAIAGTVKTQYVAPKLAGSTFLGMCADEGSCHGKSQLLSYYRVCVNGRPENVFAGADWRKASILP